MKPETIGKYLGCGVLFMLMVYIAKEMLTFPRLKEGFTSTTGSPKLKALLQSVKKETETLENATGVATNSKVWQDILIQIEDNVNLSILYEITQIPKTEGGIPKPSSEQCGKILEYYKFKKGLKPLDDFLDSYKGH